MQFDNEKKFNPLDIEELESAERAIIRAVQGVSFYEELLGQLFKEDLTSV